MEKKYKSIYDFISTVRVLSVSAATLYIAYWFLKVIHFPFVEYLGIIFEPLCNLIRLFDKCTIEYNKVGIDMAPVLSAALLQSVYFILTPFLGAVERADTSHKLNTIAEKRLEERLVNENLKEIFTAKTLEYTKFAILLSLDIKNETHPAVSSDIDKQKIAMNEYTNIVNIMRRKFTACKAVTPGKLFIIYDNFALFDDFFTSIVLEIKRFCGENTQNGLRTEFLICIDALKEDTKIVDVLDMLEKIMSFKYSNRAVATMSFNVRYKLNSEKQKYALETMGISRFFETLPDKTQIGQDIELFSLRSIKR